MIELSRSLRRRIARRTAGRRLWWQEHTFTPQERRWRDRAMDGHRCTQYWVKINEE